MTTSEIYKALKRPFPERLISWRVGATSKDKQKGIALAYIDARDVMQRLDDVLGLDWQCKYSHADSKTICELSIKVEGEWITRSGGAGDTQVEAEKGAISDAFKRAAVLFGVGQYLYHLPNEWVEIDQFKKITKPPTLPSWATPVGYDSGLTPNGYLFNSERKAILEGISDEVTHLWAFDDKSKMNAYQAWTKALPEFQSIEEQNYAWFRLESQIRTTIKTLKSKDDKRKAA